MSHCMKGYLSSHTLEDVSSPRAEGIRVLVAEDTPMGCQLLKDGLKRLRLGLGKICCAVTVNEIASLCDVRPVDVALISEDLQDGAHKGLEAVEFLRKDRPSIRSVLLVRKIRRELTLEAFRSGAKGV